MKKLALILEKFDFIINALLFGSYANGKNGFLSDIDIAIETSKDISLLEYGAIVSELEDELNKKIDLVILNELYKKEPLLAYNIYINHKPIFIKNKEKYDDFKIYALKYYTDLKPLYDLTNKALLKRIENGTVGEIKTLRGKS